MRALAVAFLLVLSLVAVAGCSDDESDARPTIVASFYPLAWAAERVAGDDYRVVNLTPPGVEPHDIELTPGDVETIHDAQLVVYVGGGFQPAVEDAVASRDGRSLDVLYGDSDPHIWLDPVRFARSVAGIARTIEDITAARPALRRLHRLDSEYRVGLRDCDRRVIVTTHAAFRQLAARYGLTQVSLAGSSPEAEPSPRELEDLVDEVRASGATTVFTEPLVSSEVAETVAREAGAAVAMLDPIEGLSTERLDAGEDYLSVMRSNLAALRKGLGCH
jgi:zinc transport system substrate-binding protein